MKSGPVCAEDTFSPLKKKDRNRGGPGELYFRETGHRFLFGQNINPPRIYVYPLHPCSISFLSFYMYIHRSLLIVDKITMGGKCSKSSIIFRQPVNSTNSDKSSQSVSQFSPSIDRSIES